MPHGESWFSFLPFHDRLVHLAHTHGGWPLNDEGHTWITGGHAGVQHVYAAIFVLSLLAIISVVTDTSIRNAGKDLLPHEKLTIRNFAELFVGGAYNMMSDIMGAKAARYFLPLIGTCAFFILFSNALGLIPGFLPSTDNLNTTLACGIVIFVVTHIYGLKENGWNHVKHLFGPIISLPALPLMLLMFAIECISHIARPASLAIRLMANMTADHKVLTIFLGFMSGIAILFPLPLPVYVLGTLVVIVQTLVFCLLSTVYIAMAIEHAEH
ncbi:MAG: F0F1 ATP synthase subunit A [Myxococcales bacterium]|nr:F0F1 ATP synthase subunit A [Myxococcales bacterium]